MGPAERAGERGVHPHCGPCAPGSVPVAAQRRPGFLLLGPSVGNGLRRASGVLFLIRADSR